MFPLVERGGQIVDRGERSHGRGSGVLPASLGGTLAGCGERKPKQFVDFQVKPLSQQRGPWRLPICLTRLDCGCHVATERVTGLPLWNEERLIVLGMG